MQYIGRDIKLKLSLIGLFPGKLGLEFIGSPFVEQRRWEPRGLWDGKSYWPREEKLTNPGQGRMNETGGQREVQDTVGAI